MHSSLSNCPPSIPNINWPLCHCLPSSDTWLVLHISLSCTHYWFSSIRTAPFLWSFPRFLPCNKYLLYSHSHLLIPWRLFITFYFVLLLCLLCVNLFNKHLNPWALLLETLMYWFEVEPGHQYCLNAPQLIPGLSTSGIKIKTCAWPVMNTQINIC